MQAENKETTEKLAAFAHRIGLLAGRRRLRQVGIAKALSTPEHRVSPQRVGSWFQGRNFPGNDVEHALAALLGTTRDWLIEGKETTESTVYEEGAVYPERSPVEVLQDQIRGRFERTLAAAGENISRLGYVFEQLEQHLKEPAHWREARSMKELVDQHEAVARERIKMESRHPVASEKSVHPPGKIPHKEAQEGTG